MKTETRNAMGGLLNHSKKTTPVLVNMEHCVQELMINKDFYKLTLSEKATMVAIIEMLNDIENRMSLCVSQGTSPANGKSAR